MAFHYLDVRKVTQDTLGVCCVFVLQGFGLERFLLFMCESAMPLCQAHTWSIWFPDGGAIWVSYRTCGMDVAGRC